MMRFLPLVALLGLSACGTLRVEVDVLDPAYMEQTVTEVVVYKEAVDLATGDFSRTSDLVQRLEQSYLTFANGCLDTIVAEFQKNDIDYEQATIDEARRRATVDEGSEFFKKMRQDLYNKDSGIATRIQTEFPATFGRQDRDSRIPDGLKALVLKRWSYYEESRQTVRTKIASLSNGCTALAVSTSDSLPQTDLLARIRQLQDDSEEDLEQVPGTTLIGTGRLLSDHVGAYYLTQADEEYWAPRFNRAYGLGIGGSTDIALKVTGTADFTVKGFVFDGRSTANMVRKGAIQALATLAASYGIPVSTQAAGTSGAGKASVTAGSLTPARAAIVDAQAKTAAYNNALLRITDAILSNDEQLVQDNQQAVRDSVETTYNAYKKLLTTN